MKSVGSEVLLDSTALIDILRGLPDALEQFGALMEGRFELSTSAINVAEVYAGMRPGEENLTTSFFNDLRIYPITLDIARRAGILKSSAARKGRTLGLDDMLVAAIALERDILLWTNNRRDFPIDGLRFYPS